MQRKHSKSRQDTNPAGNLYHTGALLDKGGQVDMVYMEMSKAFEKVCHHHLLSKLRKFCFGGKPSSMVPIIPHGPPTTCHSEWCNIKAIAYLFWSTTGLHPWPGPVSLE